MVFLLFCTFWKDNVLVLGSYFNGDLIPVLSIYLIGILSLGDIIPFSNGDWKLCIGFWIPERILHNILVIVCHFSYFTKTWGERINHLMKSSSFIWVLLKQFTNIILMEVLRKNLDRLKNSSIFIRRKNDT